jgi:ABC-type iron transport system FetAB permease component
LRRQRLDQLAAGAIEMQAKAMAAGEVPTIHSLTPCDLVQLKNLLTGLIVYGADDVGSIVQEVREAHKFRAS